MNLAKVVILIAFALVLSAGVVVGRLWARLPDVSATVTPPATMPSHQGSPSWLADQLKLTPEQRQQMDALWADTKAKRDLNLERRRQLDQQRNQAIADLLGPEQWQAYGRLIDDFHERATEIDKERMNLIHDANDRSRALLNDEQKKKWDQMRQPHHGDHDHDGGGGGGPSRGDWKRSAGTRLSSSTTQPSTQHATQ
jgi:Spy/CpxP family protein refolding chaperone